MSLLAASDRHLALQPCWVVWICIAWAQAADCAEVNRAEVNPAAAVPVEVGQRAPTLQLPVLNTSSARLSSVPAIRSHAQRGLRDLADLRGKVVYLDFWDSFCKPCRESLPLLSRLQERVLQSDVRIYSINLDWDPRRAAGFLTEYPVSFPVVSDPSAASARAYGLKTLPTAYFIGRDGRIAGMHVGFRSSDLKRIELRLVALAAEGNEQPGSE